MLNFLELLEGWEGYDVVRDAPVNRAALTRAIDLITNKGRLPSWKQEYLLREAITTTEFPYLLGQIVDSQVLARYKLVTSPWRSYIKVGSRKDFNAARLHKVQGANTFLPLVAEKGEYLTTPMSEARYLLQVAKRGRQFDISWEALVNDGMNAFGDIPQRFADAATGTEAWLVSGLYASAAGPNVLLFGAPIVDVDGGAITNVGVLPLTILNLEITLALMAAQLDVNGLPLSIRGKHLVVPPALELQARAILTSTLKQWSDVAIAGGVPLPTANVLPQLGLQLHVDPYLPVVDTSGNVNTTWYLFADLAQGAAAEFDYLRGHETPEICMKASDKVSVSGAALSPFSGDFATDNVLYRIRIVCGGTQLDPRFAYSQSGVGQGQ